MERKTILADKSNYGSSRSLDKIRGLVIHYTANDGDTDEGNAHYFQGKGRDASAHYFVDDDSVTQSVPDNYIAWHCGAKKYYHPYLRNSNTLSIEMCDTMRDGVHNLTSATKQNVIELARELVAKYHISKENVVRHYDITHKRCPAYYVDDTKAWELFKEEIFQGAPQAVVAPVIQPTPVSQPVPKSVDAHKVLIALGQAHANNFAQCGLVADGIRGSKTIEAAIKVLQRAMNVDYHIQIPETGVFGTKTSAILKNHYVKQGETQYMVTALEILLLLKGIDPKGVECPGVFGTGLNASLIAYQSAAGLTCDGVAGYNTFVSLIQ